MNNKELERSLQENFDLIKELRLKVIGMEMRLNKVQYNIDNKPSSHTMNLLKDRVSLQELKLSSTKAFVRLLTINPFQFNTGDKQGDYIVVRRVVDIDDFIYSYELFNKKTSNVFLMPKKEFEKLNLIKNK